MSHFHYGPNFEVINLVHKDRPDAISRLRAVFKSKKQTSLEPSAQRLLDFIESNCEAVVIEKNYIDGNYRRSFNRFHYHRLHDTERRCRRLHLFSRTLSSSSLTRLSSKTRSAYLGFIVLRPLPAFRLGRSIFKESLVERFLPSPDGVDTFLTCVADYSVNFIGDNIRFDGVPWMQQDRLVSACASTALWVTSWHMCHRFRPFYQPYYTPEITDIANRTMPLSRSMPSKGLRYDQMVYALREMGYEPAVHHLNYEASRRLCYLYVESAIPVILSLHFPDHNLGHAVVAVGHTLDQDFSEDSLNFENFECCGISTISDLVPSFVVMDDYAGPVRTVDFIDWEEALEVCEMNTESHSTALHDLKQKRQAISERYSCAVLIDRGQKTEQIAYLKALLAPLPSGVTLDGEEVQERAVSVAESTFKFDNKSAGLQLGPSTNRNCLRSYLIQSNAFKSALPLRQNIPVSLSRELRRHLMPKWIWVTEFARPEDLRKKNVHGMVILDSASHSGVFDNSDVVSYHFLNIASPQLFRLFRELSG